MLPQFLGKEVDDLITELLNPVCTLYLVCLLVHVSISFSSMGAYGTSHVHVHIRDFNHHP